MNLLLFVILVFFNVSAKAYEEVLNSSSTTAAGCSYSNTCSVSGIEGVCVSISAGCCSGTVTANLCPGSSDIKCCTKNHCSTPQGSGTCVQTSACTGSSIPGYCTGPSDLQCCVPGAGSSVNGYDVSTTISASSASCMKSSGAKFVVPRGYQSNCKVDTQVCPSVINAYNAGIATRDVYLFPSPTCATTASGQMNALVSYLKNNCWTQFSGRVWLDIEGSQYWTGDYTSNKNFYKSLVDSCSTYGVRCGVYSSASQWQAIFGSTSYCYGSNLPLWYAHYDNNPSFSDFSTFACWTSPYAKQYAGDASVCGMSVDKDYSPNW